MLYGQFLLLALCCGSIAFTISKTSIFIPLRMGIIKRSIFLGKLVQCPYCTSHWVVLAAMLIFRPRMIVSDLSVADYIATGFSLVGLSGIVAGSLFRLLISEE